MHYTREPLAQDSGAAAREFCKRAKIKQRSLSLLRAEMTPDTFLLTLLQQKHYTDAIRLTAHRLSRRQAIWWGCLCIEQDRGESLSATESAALDAALTWVLEPNDAHRRAAGVAAKAAEMKTPAGSLAKAVFWSGGSLSRPEYPQVPPPPHICACAVASAVLLLAASYPKDELRQQKRKGFLDLAAQIDQGDLGWEEPGIVVERSARADSAPSASAEVVEVSA